MSLRFQNSRKSHDRVPSYYVNNNLFPGSYTRNQWQTRTSRRIHEGTAIDRNYGLDTVSDDVNSSPYSSPYYINGRYNSMESVAQRGSSSSIQGITRLCSAVEDTLDDFTDDDAKTVIELWQGKQIKFEMNYSGRIVGNTISVKNTDGCTGILSIYISASKNSTPLYETAIDLCQVSMDKFEHFKLYSATTVPVTANPKGKVYVRMEIWDEISMEQSANPFNTGKKIEIAATGAGNHEHCINVLGDKNVPVKEVYEYSPMPNRPCMAFIYNNWESIPVNRSDDTSRGATVSKSGYRYDIFCAKQYSVAKLIVYDKEMNKIVPTNIPIDSRVSEVNIVQAKDYVYFVDGYSPLKKMQIGEWVPETIAGDNPPVIAASLICKHYNRIYLSGFLNDPNLVQFTEITDEGPDFDSYPYRLYAPDQSPLSTSDNPITAMVEISSDTLMIAFKHGYSKYATNADVEDAIPSQVSLFTDSGGVQSDGDICNYQGNLYSFDQDEGIRRFTGALWNKIPSSVDSYIERVDMSKPRKLWGYANKLYFNYTDALDGKYKCLIWDMDMNYQQFPWFQDCDIPFCDVRMDDDYDLVGIHPDYPVIMKMYDVDVWKRFDSPITFERHTKYVSLPGNAANMWLKRVHNKVLANSNRWWLFSLSYDSNVLKQTRGKDDWYRIPSWDTDVAEEPVESAFPTQDEYESNATALLTISNLRIQAISVQEKVKCKTFRDQACLISTVFESQPIMYK